MAIAEWPTKSGPADYALFIGTQCIGVVEAKRLNKNVSTEIGQARRYARSMRLKAEPRRSEGRGSIQAKTRSLSHSCSRQMAART